MKKFLFAGSVVLCVSTLGILEIKLSRVELIRMTFRSEGEEREAARTSEEKKKELRRVYRKLKGVRSQISMKMRELKKEVGETDFSYGDGPSDIPETDLLTEEDIENDLRDDKPEPKEKAEPIATQFELKMLVDHKAKLRKRFKKLLDQVQTK